MSDHLATVFKIDDIKKKHFEDHTFGYGRRYRRLVNPRLTLVGVLRRNS